MSNPILTDSLVIIEDSLLQKEVPDSIPVFFLENFQESIINSNSMVYSFWLSLAVLFILYLIKRPLQIPSIESNFLIVLMDYSFDVCVTLIPIIAVGSKAADKSQFGIIMIIAIMAIVIAGSRLRKKCAESYREEKWLLMLLYSIPYIIFCIFSFYTVYYYISQSWNIHML